MLDEFTRKRIDNILSNYIKDKIPMHARNQIKLDYKIRGNNVTLVEQRPAFRSDQWVDFPIAQFRLEARKWKVYWQDSKKKWHFVEDIAPDEDFEKQLKTVDDNSMGIFWT